MATRRSARASRAKSYTENIYNSESDADTENSAAPAKRTPSRRKPRVQDEEEYSVVDDEDGDLDMPDAGEEEEEMPRAKKSPKKVIYKPAKSAAIQEPANLKYVDLALATQDAEDAKGYVGSTDRGTHGNALISAWYGPDELSLEICEAMRFRWAPWKVLPPKGRPLDYPLPEVAPWLGDRDARYNFTYAQRWVDRARKATKTSGKTTEVVKKADIGHYQPPRREMPVFIGAHDDPKKLTMAPGDGFCLSQAGIPYETDTGAEKVTMGWMFDVGGIATSMDWAPREGKDVAQQLALAVIPFEDHAPYDYLEEASKPDFQKYGTVQLWEFRGQKVETGFISPAIDKPIHKWTLCMDHGRAKRVAWSPLCSFLAILCGDGNVYVVDAEESHEGLHKMIQPTATLSLANEPDVKATAMTWIAINRLAVGYSDGSIALWSIQPRRLLSRHPVHHTTIVGMVSGAPSRPYMVASYPVGGTNKLIDLRSPSIESTEVQSTVINPQAHLIGYSDHLLGFIMLNPSSRAVNAILTFSHYAHFPMVRTLCTMDSLPTCLSVGRTHPCLLVGTLDGSVWCMNPLAELLSTRYVTMDRLRIFQHEHVSARFHQPDTPAAVRGTSRIIHGFALETKPEKAEGKQAAPKPKKKKAKSAAKSDFESDDDGEGGTGATKMFMNDPGTRICSVQWNPNEAYGCWAAAAMASGLVKVMDLGIELA